MHDSLLRKKAKCCWLKKGDKNYRFFHSFMKMQFPRNKIDYFNIGGVIIDDVEGVMKASFDHFRDPL